MTPCRTFTLHPGYKVNDSNEYQRTLFKSRRGIPTSNTDGKANPLSLYRQVSLLILMVGNLDEKSLALAAILIAT
jgi:hypothetical protein